MRSFAGLFLMSVIALLWLATPSASMSAGPTRRVTPASFTPAKTLIPPPVPTAGPYRYRLKAWTEEDAIEAISEAESMMCGVDSENSQYAARLYFTTIIQETFMRFPATQTMDKLLWAYIREEVNREYGYQSGASADRFLHALEMALNTGQVEVPDLESWLHERGFTLISQHPARNLYGDSQEGQLLQIRQPKSWLESDLLAIVEGPRPGEYRVTSVEPRWRSLVGVFRESDEITVKDHNGNGRPEIVATDRGSGNSRFALYEWQGERSDGRFDNIGAEVFGASGDSYSRDYVGVWEFGLPDSNGAQPLFAILRMTNPVGRPCRDFEFKVRYEWDRHEYAWVRGDAVPLYPLQPAKCIAGWAAAAANHALYDQTIPVYVSMLAHWDQELDEVWGPSAKDYFQFKLGTWYAFADQYDLALATLMDVRDHPSNRDHDMVSRMADVFLSHYEDLNHADTACDAVTGFVRAELERIPESERTFGANDATIPHWGIAEPMWRFYSKPSFLDLCRRGWREDIPSPTQVPVSKPEITPSSQGTPTPSAWELGIQLVDRMESIEEALFIDRDARQAALLARRLVAEPIPAESYKGSKEVQPHLLYLLALSSELAGDEPGAVAAYRQLLQEYPKSHYAAMARRKLEPVTP